MPRGWLGWWGFSVAWHADLSTYASAPRTASATLDDMDGATMPRASMKRKALTAFFSTTGEVRPVGLNVPTGCPSPVAPASICTRRLRRLPSMGGTRCGLRRRSVYSSAFCALLWLLLSRLAALLSLGRLTRVSTIPPGPTVFSSSSRVEKSTLPSPRVRPRKPTGLLLRFSCSFLRRYPDWSLP